MPLVTSKRVWTQQPTNPVKVDVNNELGKKLAYACLLGPSLEDVVTGNPPVDNVNNPSVVPTNRGLARQFNSSSSQYLRPADLSLVTGYPLTVVCWLDPAASYSGGGKVVYSFNASTWNAILGLGLGETTNKWNVSLGSSTDYIAAADPGVIGMQQVAVVFRSGTFDMYINGDILSQVVNGNAWSHPAAGNYSIGARYNGASPRYWDGPVQDLYVFNGELTQDEIRRLYWDTWQVFKRQDRRIWIPSAGGGGFSLTGSLTGQGSTLSASATNTEVHALSGALVGSGATLSGSATRIYSLTGALMGQGSNLSASATNTEVHALSGVLVGAGATLSGTATRIYSLTGALTGQGATLSGSAATLESHAATGALVGAGSTLSATATNTEIHAATGSLIGAGSTLSGSATHTPVGINASGSLVGQGATLSATATNTEVHTCTGALYGQGATLSGALTRVFSASGSLVGAGSTLSATAGNAVALFSATGSLVGQGSTLTGSATNTETHAVSGSLAGQGATLSATAALANLHTLSGSLVGGGAILVGYASGPTTALDASPDAIVTVINKRNRVSVISRRS